ncbi:MAG: Xaa-Pro peptidase family protein, partial [Desulfotomaculaceae bacterium]
MKKRVEQIGGVLAEKGIDAMLVMQPENRYYLSGFTGSTGALLITTGDSYICTDFRYTEQAREQSPHLQVAKVISTLAEKLAQMQATIGFRTLAFEADYVDYTLYATLRDKLTGVELVPLVGTVEKLRQVKDRAELAAIAKSMAMLDRGFEYICGFIKPGISEIAVSLELEIFMRYQGASGTSFPFIVASGPRASLPHGEASDRVIGEGDILTMDFGVILEHYC